MPAIRDLSPQAARLAPSKEEFPAMKTALGARRRPPLSSLVSAAVLVLLSACTPEHDWTAEEIGNAEHIFQALDADRRAAEIENLGEAGVENANEAAAALEHRERALRQAQAVRDEVLAKAHPDLPRHFRDEFQRSMALFVRAAQARESDLEIEAVELRKRFGAWYRRHGQAIQIPHL